MTDQIDSRFKESHLSCAHCGASKRSRWSLCAGCFTDLPEPLRRQMYETDGGPEARAEAAGHLRRVEQEADRSGASREDVARIMREHPAADGGLAGGLARHQRNTPPPPDAVRLASGQTVPRVGLPAPVHDFGGLPARTVCTVCNRFGVEGQRPGGRCGMDATDGRPGSSCMGVLRYSDGRAYSAVIAVGRGVTGMRSRSDIATDIAGGREAVTPGLRRFVEAVCDLLEYLPHQSMFPEGD